MNVKNWSFFYNKEGKQELKQNILDTVSLWGVIGLLWYSFVSIIGEHFPEFLQIKVLASKINKNPSISYVGEMDYELIGMDWWVISLFVVVLWLGYDWPKQYLKKLVIPCRLAGIAVPVVYVVVNFQKIVDGFWHLAAIYLPFINNYYKTRFYFEPMGQKEYAVVAFTAISMLLWWLVWLLAYGWKKRVLLVMFPLLALVLELTVGLSAQGNGLLCIFFAAVLLSIMGGASVLKKALVMACVGLSVLLSEVWFAEDIQSLVAKETKQAVLRWQNNLSLESINPFKMLEIDLHFNWETLNNDTPQYTGKIVLEVETDKAPVSTVYLKGFYGTNYENGNWTYDDSAFQSACQQAGKSPDEVAEQIFQMPYERMYEADGGQSHSFDELVEYKISYVGTTGDVAYVPYVSDYTSMDQSYTFLGDYLLKKSLWDQSIVVKGLNTQSTTLVWRGVNDSIAIGTFGYEHFSYYSHYYIPIDLTEQLEELKWVNDLADAYLQIPEDAEFISEAGLKFRGYLLSYVNRVAAIDMDSDNYTRIVYATAVADYLEEQMSYSLKLDNLPAGADPIEYALTQSHEGYCMHFASAATILLREIGVPARYVSGYAVVPSAFGYDEETSSYRAEVGDFMAHAWVEIYLDNIGWVPVEVTPGSSLDSLPTDEEIQQWESDSNAHRQDIVDQERESEIEESEQSSDATEVESEESESEDTDVTTESEASRKEPEDEERKNSDDTNVIEILLQGAKVLTGIALVILTGLLVRLSIKRFHKRFESVLEHEVENNQTRRAVKRINRRLYYMLRISKGKVWFVRKWTDAEYQDVLINEFTGVSEEQWKRYMEIVKKNYYSHETISPEEMQYCYECYKKVKLFNKTLTLPW